MAPRVLNKTNMIGQQIKIMEVDVDVVGNINTYQILVNAGIPFSLSALKNIET